MLKINLIPHHNKMLKAPKFPNIINRSRHNDTFNTHFTKKHTTTPNPSQETPIRNFIPIRIPSESNKIPNTKQIFTQRAAKPLNFRAIFNALPTTDSQ